MDSIISRWKPGQPSVGSRAPPGGFGSTNVGLPGKPPRDDHSNNQAGKSSSSAGAQNPPPSQGTALPSSSTQSLGTSLTSSDEGGNWEQEDVDEDSIALEGPYVLFHGPAKGLGSKTKIVGSRVFFPGYSSLPGKVRGKIWHRAENYYCFNVEGRDVPFSPGLPLDDLARREITTRIKAPKLEIRYIETSGELGYAEQLLGANNISLDKDLDAAFCSRSFTNYAARRMDYYTGEWSCQLCLDTLKPSNGYPRLLTPRGNDYIDLGTTNPPGLVNRVCIQIRPEHKPKRYFVDSDSYRNENPNQETTTVTIVAYNPNVNAKGSLWHHIEKMMAHPVWAYNAVYNTEWIIWEAVKFQLDWKRLHSQLRERISQICEEVLLEGTMTDAVKVLHQELNVLQDWELAFESNMGVLTNLSRRFYDTSSTPNDFAASAQEEYNNIAGRLEHNALFIRQLKNEILTTIDMIFNAVQVDQSIQALKESGLVYEQSESIRRLTYLTVLFLPATFMATIFGMNSPSTSSPPLWLFFATSVPLSMISFAVLYGLRYITWFQDTLGAIVFSLSARIRRRHFRFGHRPVSPASSEDIVIPQIQKRTRLMLYSAHGTTRASAGAQVDISVDSRVSVPGSSDVDHEDLEEDGRTSWEIQPIQLVDSQPGSSIVDEVVLPGAASPRSAAVTKTPLRHMRSSTSSQDFHDARRTDASTTRVRRRIRFQNNGTPSEPSFYDRYEGGVKFEPDRRHERSFLRKSTTRGRGGTSEVRGERVDKYQPGPVPDLSRRRRPRDRDSDGGDGSGV